MSPWLNICVGASIFCLSISPIKSSDWTSALLDSQLPCKVGSSLTIYFLSNKHKQERQSCVCVVLKIAGFKSKYKPRAFLCSKTLPLVKGWDVGYFYFLYYNKLSLQQHSLGNLALIRIMAESWLAFRAPGGIFTRVFLAPWQGDFRALG